MPVAPDARRRSEYRNLHLWPDCLLPVPFSCLRWELLNPRYEDPLLVGRTAQRCPSPFVFWTMGNRLASSPRLSRSTQSRIFSAFGLLRQLQTKTRTKQGPTA